MFSGSVTGRRRKRRGVWRQSSVFTASRQEGTVLALLPVRKHEHEMSVKRRRRGPGSQPSFDAQFDEVFGAPRKRRGLLACGRVVLIIVAAVLFAGT